MSLLLKAIIDIIIISELNLNIPIIFKAQTFCKNYAILYIRTLFHAQSIQFSIHCIKKKHSGDPHEQV